MSEGNSSLNIIEDFDMGRMGKKWGPARKEDSFGGQTKSQVDWIPPARSKAPRGVHFLHRRDDLTRLMDAASMLKDGRGGTVSKPPVRFGPHKK